MKEQLELPGDNFSTIQWVTPSSTGKSIQPIPSDQVFFTRSNKVLMPGQVKDDLTVADWKPIMASSLVFEKKILHDLRWKLLLYKIAPTGIFLILVFGLAFLLGDAILIALLGFLVLAFATQSLATRQRISSLKKGRLKADEQVGDLFGKQSLLGVLKKLQSMNLEDVNPKTRPRRGIFRGLPTVTERVEHLRGYTTKVKV